MHRKKLHVAVAQECTYMLGFRAVRCEHKKRDTYYIRICRYVLGVIAMRMTRRVLGIVEVVGTCNVYSMLPDY